MAAYCDSYETLTAEKEAENQTSHFKTVVEAFVEANPLLRNLRSFDIRGAHTWDEVLKTVDSAKEVYESKAKGKKGIHIRAARGLSQNANDISPWLELLPDGDYSSVICGGLKLVFGVSFENDDCQTGIKSHIGCGRSGICSK